MGKVSYSLRIIALLFAALFASSSLNAAADYATQNKIRQATRSITPLVEFADIYHNGFYFLKNEQGRKFVEVRTLLTPCYELIMRVPVGENDGQLIQLTPAEVELVEITGVSIDASGSLAVDKVSPSRVISQADWLVLYRTKGDFSSIGINMRPGIMMQGMDTYRDQLRSKADVSW